MLELSKNTRKRLRELKAIAYTKELEQHLLKLAANFDKWKGKKIDCWNLSDQIHKFHDGISRELFERYNATGVNDVVILSSAVARGLLHIDDIPDEVADLTANLVDNFFEK